MREFLKLLGLTQKQLAEQIAYASSALSEALRFPDPKTINDDKWSEIVGFFETRAKASQAELTRRGVTTRAEQLLQELQSGSSGPTIHVPGGRLLANAKNYVKRQCDQLLFQSRTSNIADHPGAYPAVLVRGGIQSGRSSLLERLRWEAERKGRGVRSVDLRNVVKESSDTLPDVAELANQVFQFIFAEFDIPPASVDAGQFDLSTWIVAFTDFAAKLDRHTFFLFDSLDLILHVDRNAAVFNDLIRFLAKVRDVRTDLVSTVVTYSAGGWRYIHGSPYANSAWEVTTAPFTLEQVGDLLRLLFAGEKVEDLDAVSRVLSTAFNGQPHLTHLAAFGLKNNPSGDPSRALEAVLQEAGLKLRSEGSIEPAETGNIVGAYRTHWERMRREIRSLLRERESIDASVTDEDAEDHRVKRLGELLRNIVENASKEPEQALLNDSVRLFDRLAALGLLSGRFPGFLSPFYNAAMRADPSFRA